MDFGDRKFSEPTYYSPTPVGSTVTTPSRETWGRTFMRKAKFGILAIVLQVSVLLVLHGHSTQRSGPSTVSHHASPAEFDWFALEPKQEIEWTPCYSGQKCARLLLPLDYDTPDSPTTAIALRMIPATDVENYRGTVLFNPGGPGGSGVDLIERHGMNFSRIIGPSFDVLGFDPRGTGFSTPDAVCFDTDSQRGIWQTQEGHQLLNASDNSVGLFRARAQLTARRCEEKLGGKWGIGRHLGTGNVARDMLEITQKLGQDKLKYWGFSYGTVLGQYFAAMFPDKVHRLVIDGVYDSHDYRAGLWATNIADIDHIVAGLFSFCHRAGPEKCAMYDSSPAKIRARFFSILDNVEKNPIAVPLSDPPAVITRKSLVKQLFRGTYTPLTSFPVIVNTLHAIETANATALQALAPGVAQTVECKCSEKPPITFFNDETTWAIGCGDADPRSWDLAAYQEYYKGLEDMSHLMAPMWAGNWLQCAEWKIRPESRYTGPLEARNTSHPILAVTNRYDPVTPYSDAYNVHKRYGGAGLLVQDGHGHCTTSAPSLCTAKHLRRYFEDGTLPEEGTVCEVDELPLVGETKLAARNTEDMELLEALRGLSGALPVFAPL